ncbi:uncharacterized protein Z519_02264 [Cladophialophora bantiana CBS 173.52]|uniref:tRNA(Phe) 7-[(3-amino-3-carboxypropyl)-4-demethylwyosine(37)-N(4)]-methyltransferase n=1 Tax=Cladophialophora bantiana (strain ATCC 10958 / CBS 173.52 / CDC B-1940 / NIH 8579) TaxID=1442370 RepID=A0A0D2HTW8_CLAB1|nr:uncharacterized protein Z519_02264 [Cladophialophora bantiana CBS 173.52]KIW96873.1 hypothetical protein Z519_02264 [Cladophialophora bantiana CBS 173.52]
MSYGAAANPSSVPASFVAKKSQILSHLDQPEGTYTDNSPKGTVDAQIRDLIDEINRYDGLVTTSSCAGRVAVFVEGPGGRRSGRGGANRRRDVGEDVGEKWEMRDSEREGRGERQVSSAEAGVKGKQAETTSTPTSTSPGGKGGGRWLYVSHDPLPVPIPPDGVNSTSATGATTGFSAAHDSDDQDSSSYFSRLFQLANPSSSASSPSLSPSFTFFSSARQPPRLIHLSFSPLILHILCATLRHARPLLTAAVNAGFRESGVQSLRGVLEESSEQDHQHGVMVAVRTAGLVFETVVGVALPPPGCHAGGEEKSMVTEEGETDRDVIQRVVSEEYLGLCARVVNERFQWNLERRERFRRELKSAMERDGLGSGPETLHPGWEDKEERRRRKREEGLQRQRVMMNKENTERDNTARQGNNHDELDQGLSTLEID